MQLYARHTAARLGHGGECGCAGGYGRKYTRVPVAAGKEESTLNVIYSNKFCNFGVAFL